MILKEIIMQITFDFVVVSGTRGTAGTTPARAKPNDAVRHAEGAVMPVILKC